MILYFQYRKFCTWEFVAERCRPWFRRHRLCICIACNLLSQMIHGIRWHSRCPQRAPKYQYFVCSSWAICLCSRAVWWIDGTATVRIGRDRSLLQTGRMVADPSKSSRCRTSTADPACLGIRRAATRRCRRATGSLVCRTIHWRRPPLILLCSSISLFVRKHFRWSACAANDAVGVDPIEWPQSRATNRCRWYFWGSKILDYSGIFLTGNLADSHLKRFVDAPVWGHVTE